MKNSVLYRVSKNSVTKRKTYLYVVPDAVKPVVLKDVHDQAGHQDQQRTMYLARQRLFWQLLNVAGVQISRPTPYHPMGNGACERMNRTRDDMIRALPAKTKHKWPQVLKSLSFAYNCNIYETTGCAPFLLMFGRALRLPVDLIFETVLDDPDVVNYDSYIQALRRDMKEAMHAVQASAMKQLKRHADLYNRRVRSGPIDVGDQALPANKGARGKRKLADLWEDTTYTVVGFNIDSHTYIIQHNRTGVVKNVHRNLIIPVNFLPFPDDDLDDTNICIRVGPPLAAGAAPGGASLEVSGGVSSAPASGRGRRGGCVAVRGGDSGRAPGPSRGSPQLRPASGPPSRCSPPLPRSGV